MVTWKHNLLTNGILITGLLLVIATGCTSGPGLDNPVTPTVQGSISSDTGAGHYLMGYGEGYITEGHDSLELVPARGSSIHLNARRFLEYSPCNDCLSLTGILVDAVEETIEAEIQLRHPFPGLTKFTGFNTRAVVITDGSRIFPELDAVVPDYTLGDFTLMNPSGYTKLWNTVDYPEGSGAFPILEYSRGNLASAGEFSGTVNPYILFSDGVRESFTPGGVSVQNFIFKLAPGAMRFGYAIDVSWEAPLYDPPINILTDFPASANCLETVFQSIEQDVEHPLYDKTGSEGGAVVTLFDYQGAGTVSTAYLECTDLWDGVIVCDGIEPTMVTNVGEYMEAEFNLTNATGASAGDYTGLLKVEDKYGDYWLGEVNNMYQPVTISIEEFVGPELTGKAVFVAPGPSGTGYPGAANVFLYDFDAMMETQLTNFSGVGYLFHEPRINPLGTHHLHCAGPTPYYGNVRMYEFGGDTWTISTDEVDDYADFHPDGTHIITATGTQWGDTPDIYSMNYDGTGRIKMATAPDSISGIAVSPDGNHFALVLGINYTTHVSELWIYNNLLDQFHEIMATESLNNNPAWSPVQIGGEYLLAFESNRHVHPELDTDIYIVNPVTQAVLCQFGGLESESHPTFSPDGESIMYSVKDAGGDTELYVYEWYTDGNTYQITDDESSDGSPSWCWNW